MCQRRNIYMCIAVFSLLDVHHRWRPLLTSYSDWWSRSPHSVQKAVAGLNSVSGEGSFQLQGPVTKFNLGPLKKLKDTVLYEKCLQRPKSKFYMPLHPSGQYNNKISSRLSTTHSPPFVKGPRHRAISLCQKVAVSLFYLAKN